MQLGYKKNQRNDKHIIQWLTLGMKKESFKVIGNVFLKLGCEYRVVGFTIFCSIHISLYNMYVIFIVLYECMIYLIDILIKVVNFLNKNNNLKHKE